MEKPELENCPRCRISKPDEAALPWPGYEGEAVPTRAEVFNWVRQFRLREATSLTFLNYIHLPGIREISRPAENCARLIFTGQCEQWVHLGGASGEDLMRQNDFDDLMQTEQVVTISLDPDRKLL